MRKLVMILLTVSLMSIGTYSFADMGMGHGCGRGRGCSAMQNLSAEDMQKVYAERDAFWKSVDPIRGQIQQKHVELRTEMSKSPADTEKISALEQELSTLRSQMDAKRLQFQANLKNINAALGDCFMGGRGYGKGHGWHHGQYPNKSSDNGEAL